MLHITFKNYDKNDYKLSRYFSIKQDFRYFLLVSKANTIKNVINNQKELPAFIILVPQMRYEGALIFDDKIEFVFSIYLTFYISWHQNIIFPI